MAAHNIGPLLDLSLLGEPAVAPSQSNAEEMADSDSYELVAQYQAGGSEAATAIFDRYVARLVALTRSRLSVKLLRRVDPEDVVQSAFRSFFLHARDEAYVLKQSGDLWRLLVQITLHKLYGQSERHRAK